MARKNNSLSDVQVARLYRWLDESRVWASEQTAQKVAEMAATELKFGVTSSNILTAKRNLNITKPKPAVLVGECRCKEIALLLAHWFDPANHNVAGAEIRDAFYTIAGKPTPETAPALPFVGGAQSVTVPVAPGVSVTMSAGTQQAAS